MPLKDKDSKDITIKDLHVQDLHLEQCRAFLKPRPKSAHKGDFGHVLIVGGDYGMGGAVRLAGEAALRSGAGLVSIATHPEHAFAIMSACSELMCHGIDNIDAIEPLLQRATVVVLGPGLGLKEWGRSLFFKLINTDLPLVIDADGLNILAENYNKISMSSKISTKRNWVLTPHPGEAERLLKHEMNYEINHKITHELQNHQIQNHEIQEERLVTLQQLFKKYQGVIVLKGAGTLVMNEENKAFCAKAGNPGMATAGMGDVLSGVIGALIAQKLTPLEASLLGVMAHATAGDNAAKNGARGMKASDLFDEIRQCLNT